jgi:hypothetical protein
MESSEERWITFLDHPQAENVVPEPWMSGNDISLTNEAARILKKLIIIKILRPDRLVTAVEQFVVKVLGQEVLDY